jgi:16S rRNA (guanine527-N7)-methyltransferase
VPPVVNEEVSANIGSVRAALPAPRSAALAQGASAPVVADVGSGAGFPGIPLKLWAPQIHLTLIESNHKKATFLREVARALILTNVDIQTARAETIAETMTEKFDAVTLRAVERFEAILPVAATLVAPSGRLALLIGAAQVPQARALLPTLAWSDPKPIPRSGSRVLLIATQPSHS